MNWVNIEPIADKTLKFCMHDACDKTSRIVCKSDLELDLWPISHQI